MTTTGADNTLMDARHSVHFRKQSSVPLAILGQTLNNMDESAANAEMNHYDKVYDPQLRRTMEQIDRSFKILNNLETYRISE